MSTVTFLKSYGDVPYEFAQQLVEFRGLAAEAQYHSGATSHDTFGFARDSPYVCPETGTGVVADYLT